MPVIDLNEWTLEDSDGSLTVQGGRVGWVKADRSAVRYIGARARRVLNEETDEFRVDSGEVQGVVQHFDWIWIASTIKSRRNNGNWSTGYVENLIM